MVRVVVAQLLEPRCLSELDDRLSFAILVVLHEPLRIVFVFELVHRDDRLWLLRIVWGRAEPVPLHIVRRHGQARLVSILVVAPTFYSPLQRRRPPRTVLLANRLLLVRSRAVWSPNRDVSGAVQHEGRIQSVCLVHRRRR